MLNINRKFEKIEKLHDYLKTNGNITKIYL